MPIWLTDDGALISYVDVTREVRSPRHSLCNDRSTSRRVIDVPYLQGERFAQAVTGYSQSASFASPIDGQTYSYIKRTVPWFAVLDTNKGVFCTKCEWEGYATPTGFTNNAGAIRTLTQGTFVDGTSYPIYDSARCTLEYETPTYDILSDARLFTLQDENANPYDESPWRRFVTILPRPQGEFLAIEGANFNGYYIARVLNQDNNPFPASKSLNKAIYKTSLTVTWHQIPQACVPFRFFNPNSPNKAINWCTGRVNDRTFNGFPQGTLLLLSAELKPYKNPRGERIYDIVYQFSESRQSEDPQFIATLAGAPLFAIYPGHNHTFVPRTKLSGSHLAIGGAPQAGWYELVGDDTIASVQPFTNFIDKKKGVNIYDFGNFANLFRPAGYTQDLVT